jgi:hypothetical protein
MNRQVFLACHHVANDTSNRIFRVVYYHVSIVKVVVSSGVKHSSRRKIVVIIALKSKMQGVDMYM